MAADKTVEEFGISPAALESLERDFVEVMRELSAQDNLERFKLEYEKLHRALKKSHESEKRLIKKCQELNHEITSNAANVQAALKLSQDDESTIQSLRKEIEKAWKMVDNAHEKESRAKDTIQHLKKEVNRLKTLVDQGAGLTLGQESDVQELTDQKREYAKERDSLNQKMVQQTHELKELTEHVKKLEAAMQSKDTELQTKLAAFTQLRREYEAEQHKKEANEGKVQELHKTIEKKTKESETLKEQARSKADEMEKLERLQKEEREKVHELTIQAEKSQLKVQQSTDMLGQMDAQNFQYKKEIPRLRQVLETKVTEVQSGTQKKEQLAKAVEAQDREMERLKREKEAEYVKTAEYEKRIKELTEEIEGYRRTLEEAERDVKDQVRDKNLCITKAVRCESQRVRLEGEHVIEIGKNRSLAQELDSHRKENHRLQKKVYELEQQRESYHELAQEATQRYNTALEQVKLGKQKHAQHVLELQEAEHKLKNQQSMYEQVRSERTLYNKNLREAQEEIAGMKRKFKRMDHEIDQLKDELSHKEKKLCEAHSNHKAISDEFSKAEKRVQHLKADYENAMGRCEALEDEIKQLAQIIADCDAEHMKQQMKFNSVTNERNILATQLIRRNEELTILYEKIRIQQSTLGKGEAQYRERLVDIRMTREKIHELRSALRVSLARIKNVEEIKRQIATLQRQLIQERTKVKALYEELQNPMNVHRWRKLEGSNPHVFENIQKIQTLQKRLIAKTHECTSKDAVIQEKERLYVDLKNILARQPGPEIAEQLSVFHDNIVKRTEQMRRMGRELEGSHVQVSEQKQDLDRLNVELLSLKKKFFNLKSKNQLLLREKRLASGQDNVDDGVTFQIQHPPKQPRFAGGGFSLSQ